jgi:hypothetical protein
MNEDDMNAFMYAYEGAVYTLIIATIYAGRPVEAHGLAEDAVARVTERARFTDAAICSICIAPHGRRGSVKLPCMHCYHRTCIARWLERATTCPVCRFELRDL